MTRHYNKKKETGKRRKLRKSQTYAERIMWIHLRNRQTLGYKFRRQYSVDQYVLDFYCPELKLAIELDGEVHDLEDQKEYDIVRQKYIEEFGISFLRFTNEEFLGNPNKTFHIIEKQIKNKIE